MQLSFFPFFFFPLSSPSSQTFAKISKEVGYIFLPLYSSFFPFFSLFFLLLEVGKVLEEVISSSSHFPPLFFFFPFFFFFSPPCFFRSESLRRSFHPSPSSPLLHLFSSRRAGIGRRLRNCFLPLPFPSPFFLFFFFLLYFSFSGTWWKMEWWI